MKILFISVGRRMELMQAFRCAAEKLKIDLIIMGVDITEDAPALYFCDKTQIVCRIEDRQYIPMLLKLCKEEKVDCLVPMIDTDSSVLVGNKGQFGAIGAKVLVSAADKVKLRRDKNYTADYLASLGLKSPLSFNDLVKYEAVFKAEEQHLPAFIRPKGNSSSMSAYRVDNLEDLKRYAERIEDYIIRPFISDREYMIGIFCDYYENPVYITPGKRLTVRAGEVPKTKIIQDDTMTDEILMLIKDFKPCGQITVQLIRDGDTGEDYCIEINPHFGGGASLSMKAGADSVEAVIRMLTGGRMECVEKAARDGGIYSRFDQSIYVKKGKARIGSRRLR